jgi:hypothetical protein
LYVVNIRLNERASGLAASNNQFKGRPPAEKEDGHTHKEREKERERERNGKRESEREREALCGGVAQENGAAVVGMNGERRGKQEC